MLFDKTKSVWYERYKPQCIDDVILPEELKLQLKDYIKNQNMPNLGFWSSEPGLGKSSTANAIIKELKCDALWINASLEKGIDILRGKIQKFASQSSFDNDIRIVVMDECLEENEKVILIKDHKEIPIKLNELEKGKIYDCKSFNMKTGNFENDTCEVISDKIDEIYEVTLEDGRTIKVTANHPFIVYENGKYIEKSINDGLNENDDIRVLNSFLKLKSIKKLGTARVINLTVHKNHTFITENGIVTHNCDNISKDSQSAFRGFLDEFSQNCRFIFTGNYKEKVIEPLLDRLSNFEFNKFEKSKMVKPIFQRLKFILDNENIEYNEKDIAQVIFNYYPKIRSMVGYLQKASSNGKFVLSASELDDKNVFEDVILSLKGNYLDLVKKVNSLNSPDNFYSFLYNNAQNYFEISKYPSVILICAKYQHMSSSVRDKNLNLCACLTELMRI